MTKNDVLAWLQAGMDAEKGVQLMVDAGAPSLVIRMIRINPSGNLPLIRQWLCDKFDVRFSPPVPEVETRSFRDEFPFLDEPGCPMQLEALASRKITQYRAYVKLHQRLRYCSSLEECASVSRELINNYLENRMIWEELKYYQEHRSILGKHPLLAAYARRQATLSMSVKELFRKQKQLKQNIWRVKNELAKGDKPHLELERRMRLRAYEDELAEINKILDE